MHQQISPTDRVRHVELAWLVLIVLLLLRIPYVLAIISFLPIEDQTGGAVYEVGTYLLTAILIWWERDRLADFHIETSALVLILVFRPIQTLILAYWHVESPLAFPNPFGLMLWGISGLLLLALLIGGWRPARISKQTMGWLLAGAAAGIVASVLENLGSFSSIFNAAHPPSTRITPLLISGSLNLAYHLGFAPIGEEPLFRGFLWGYLRKLEWKERWIWLFQAVLFTLAHVYFADQYPLRFWVLIPISGLLLGWLAWRSRTIASSMLMHGLINGSVYVLVLGLLSLA